MFFFVWKNLSIKIIHSFAVAILTDIMVVVRLAWLVSTFLLRFQLVWSAYCIDFFFFIILSIFLLLYFALHSVLMLSERLLTKPEAIFLMIFSFFIFCSYFLFMIYLFRCSLSQCHSHPYIYLCLILFIRSKFNIFSYLKRKNTLIYLLRDA